MPQSPVFQRVNSLFSFLFMDPLTVAHHAPLSMEIPRQEYWSQLSIPFPVDLVDPGMKLWSAALQVDSLSTKLPGNLYSLGDVYQ